MEAPFAEIPHRKPLAHLGRGLTDSGGISHTLGRCISNIGTPPFSNIGTVRYGAERVKLRRVLLEERRTTAYGQREDVRFFVSRR